jgi:proline dehydrogenase
MNLPFFLAARFVAAETISEALPKVQQINQKGLKVTLDLLGEYVSDKNVANGFAKTYVQLIKQIGKTPNLDCNISIKLSMIGQKIDAQMATDHLFTLLEEAQKQDIFVRLDMEGSDITQSTLDILEKVYPHYPQHVGTVLQAYLHRTADDVQRMIELQARVRLCKGAYKEPAHLAYQEMPVIREKFLGYMEQLISKGNYPGIATHDDILIQATQHFVTKQHIAKDRFEFQMLYGIREETQLQIAQNHNMRIYVPYGTEWLPYFSRRLRERKENVWFIVSNMFKR